MLMELDFFSQGKEYISASRAAKKTGYTPDYIGQLCRAGKIAGKLIDRTWYVDFESLLAHKRTRQLGKPRRAPELLAPQEKGRDILKIQALPVEVRSPAPVASLNIAYTFDPGPLLPRIAGDLAAKPAFRPARRVSANAYVSVLLMTAVLIGARLVYPEDFVEQSEKLVLQASAIEGKAPIFLEALADSAAFMKQSFESLEDLAFSSQRPGIRSNAENNDGLQ
jgi:hypothetical protein